MPDRRETAVLARKEAFAMCRGCPMTPNEITAFVAQWVASELLWFDSCERRKQELVLRTPEKTPAVEVEEFISAHPHWEESVKQEWRDGVAAGDTHGLIRNRHLVRADEPTT